MNCPSLASTGGTNNNRDIHGPIAARSAEMRVFFEGLVVANPGAKMTLSYGIGRGPTIKACLYVQEVGTFTLFLRCSTGPGTLDASVFLVGIANSFSLGAASYFKMGTVQARDLLELLERLLTDAFEVALEVDRVRF